MIDSKPFLIQKTQKKPKKPSISFIVRLQIKNNQIYTGKI